MRDIAGKHVLYHPSVQKGCTGLFRLSHITMPALEVAGKGVETEKQESS
jgi:hypothetical protein